MLIVYLYTLKTVNILYFINKILLNSTCSFNFKNIMRINRTISNLFASRYFVSILNKYMSSEWCLEIIGDDVNDGDTIEFRLQRTNGDLLDAYLITPVVTVFKPGDVGPARFNLQGGNVDIKGGVINNQ